jgi:D-amino-acid dehydrogenase
MDMHVMVLGAGVIGVSTAWHLLQRGHSVTLIDRQPDAALETSFGNAAQISVSYCEPWANRHTPLKALKWLFDPDGPLKFRPQLDPAQWHWVLQFLGQCNHTAFKRNVAQIVALGRYSHDALKQVVADTGITYQRLTKGIAHYYTDQKAFDEAGAAAELMRGHGVNRRVVDREELICIEPALRAYADQIVGGTYTQSDESGDCRVFTQALMRHCETKGLVSWMSHEVEQIQAAEGSLQSVRVRSRLSGSVHTLPADTAVVACGSYSTALMRQVGVRLPVYPGKGYSATLDLIKPEGAPHVSLLDDQRKIAISRLGQKLRVAGTIELGGFDLSLDTPLARRRAEMLVQRIEEVFPGVADTRLARDGGDPRLWCGLRPATPSNIPIMGQSPVRGLWVNTGHGTLGWTHAAGSGKALAELIGGEQPAMPFEFWGAKPSRTAQEARPPLSSST